MRFSVLIPTMALAAAACTPKAETPEQAMARMQSESAAARTTIDSLSREFANHLNMGHADVVAGFYADNAVVMPPNMPAATTRDAIMSAFGEFIAMKAQLTLTPVSVVANGPMAVERGTYSVTMTPPGATAPVTDTGKYLVHWHLMDGKWMLVEDIWNSDLPPMPMPAGKP
jgi:ketosteroid isomerase-like protein